MSFEKYQLRNMEIIKFQEFKIFLRPINKTFMRMMRPLVSKKDNKTVCQDQRKALLREAREANPKRREQLYKSALNDFRNAAELLFQLSELLLRETHKPTECESIEDPTDLKFCYQATIARNTVREMISSIILAGINRSFQEEDELQERLFQVACRELFMAKCSGLSDLTVHIRNEETLSICMPRDCLMGFEAETILGFDVLVCESCMVPILQNGVPQTFNRVAKCVGYDQTKDVFILEEEDGTKDYTDVRCIHGIVIKEIHDPKLVTEVQSFWKTSKPPKKRLDQTSRYIS
ncbi:MAG: hypothetical protein ACFFC7_19890 [Candidatus Hermodarchaeota archaeon]